MRIIGGQYRGFRFEPHSKIPARPTTDRSKESLINILLSNYELQDQPCLDLFSGTGNLAYEFASQGASSVTAIDANFHSVAFIKLIFNQLKFKEHHIINCDVFKWLKQAHSTQYKIIFADPPYDHLSLSLLPKLVFNANLLLPGGVLVVEHRASLSLTHDAFKYHRDYGQSRFSFFECATDV